MWYADLPLDSLLHGIAVLRTLIQRNPVLETRQATPKKNKEWDFGLSVRCKYCMIGKTTKLDSKLLHVR